MPGGLAALQAGDAERHDALIAVAAARHGGGRVAAAVGCARSWGRTPRASLGHVVYMEPERKHVRPDPRPSGRVPGHSQAALLGQVAVRFEALKETS